MSLSRIDAARGSIEASGNRKVEVEARREIIETPGGANRAVLVIRISGPQSIEKGDELIFSQEDLRVLASVAGLQDRE